MVAALIKLVQGALAPPAGESLLGVQATPVTISNNDDTGVVRWTYELLDVPNNSALSPGILSDGAVPAAILTPDPADQEVWGCYRIKLTVYDSGGGQATDIRNFAVGTPNNQWIVPSFLAEASEMNFGGTDRGWKKWVNEILEKVDLIDARWSMPPDSSTRFLSVGRGIRNGSFVERYGYYSTYFGHNVGLGATGIPPSGERNAGFGHNSLLRLSSGTRNCTHGILAGAAISSADHCVMFGYYTAAGGLSGLPPWFVTGDYNATFGSYGLLNLRAGEGNATFGTRPGENIRDGDRNVGYGWMPLYYVQDGNDNIGIGTLAGPTADVDGSISIGAYATAYAAWTCQFGGTGAYAIDVGFGLSSAPTARVHLPPGTATKAPLRFSVGVLKTVPGDGEVAYDGTHFYADISGARYQLDQQAGGGGTTQREDDSVGQRTVRNPIRARLQSTEGASVSSADPVPGSLVAYRGLNSGASESGFAFLTFAGGTIHMRSASTEGANVVDNANFSSTLNRGKAIQLVSEYTAEDDAVAVFTESDMRVYKLSGGNNALTQQYSIAAAYTGDPTICGKWLFVANTTDAQIYAALARVDGSTPTSVLTLTDLTESIVGDSFGNLFVVTTTTGVSTIRRYTVDQTTGALTLAKTRSFGAYGECTTNLIVDGRYVFCGSVESGTYYLVRYDVALDSISGAESTVDLPSRSYVATTAEYVWTSGTSRIGCWDPELLFELDTLSIGEGGSFSRGLAADPDSRTVTALIDVPPNVALVNVALTLPPLRASNLSFPNSSLKTTGATKLLGLNTNNEVVTAAVGGGSLSLGVYASRPAPATNSMYVCTDSPYPWVSDGAAWYPLVCGSVVGVEPPLATAFTSFNSPGGLVQKNGHLLYIGVNDGASQQNRGFVLTGSYNCWVEAIIQLINLSNAGGVAAYPEVGLILRESSSQRSVSMTLYVETTVKTSMLLVQYYSNDSTPSTVLNACVLPADNNGPFFIRLRCGMATSYAEISRDRQNWFVVWSDATATYFNSSPDQLGIVGKGKQAVPYAFIPHFAYRNI